MSDLTIGVVMEVQGSEYYGGILGGIERATRERHARLLMFHGTPIDVAAAPFAREVRGWIAVHSPVGLTALTRLGLPLVTVAYHRAEVEWPAVVADNSQGTREAVRHLIAHGHRRIAFIGWLGYPGSAERYEGYRDALTESGLPCSPEWAWDSRLVVPLFRRMAADSGLRQKTGPARCSTSGCRSTAKTHIRESRELDANFGGGLCDIE